GDEIAFELLAERPELTKLEPVVAHDAGVRRAAREIFIREVIDDAIEFLLEIEGVKRNVEPIRDAPAIASVDRRATTLLAVASAIVRTMRASAHEQPDHVVSLLFQQIRAHRAIHTAAHG